MVQQLIVHFLLLTYTHEQFHRDKPYFLLCFFLSFFLSLHAFHLHIGLYSVTLRRNEKKQFGLTASRIELDIVEVQRCSSSWPTVRSLTYTPEQFVTNLFFFFSASLFVSLHAFNLHTGLYAVLLRGNERHFHLTDFRIKGIVKVRQFMVYLLLLMYANEQLDQDKPFFLLFSLF